MLAEWVANVPEEGLKVFLFGFWALDTRKDLSDIASVVAVVEKGDILVGPERCKEVGKSTRAFWELEHKQAFVLDFATATNEES